MEVIRTRLAKTRREERAEGEQPNRLKIAVDTQISQLTEQKKR